MRRLQVVAVIVLLLSLPTPAPAVTPAEVAEPVVRPAGAPGAADVIMRTLGLHPRNKQDPHDTWKAIEGFHVTRLEWSYVTDPTFIAKVNDSGRIFGGAASFSDENDSRAKLAIRDAMGKPIIAPWMRNWNQPRWGCVNNPEYERGYIRHLEWYINAGAVVMQRDGPRANFLATRWGGCFCEHCMAGFEK